MGRLKLTVVEEGGRFVVRGDGKRLDAFGTRKEADDFRRGIAFMEIGDLYVERLVDRLMRLAKTQGLTKAEARDYIGSCLRVSP